MADRDYGALRNGAPFINAQPRFGVYRDWRAETQPIHFDKIMFWNADPSGRPPLEQAGFETPGPPRAASAVSPARGIRGQARPDPSDRGNIGLEYRPVVIIRSGAAPPADVFTSVQYRQT
jgi:hypothetical protein